MEWRVRDWARHLRTDRDSKPAALQNRGQRFSLRWNHVAGEGREFAAEDESGAGRRLQYHPGRLRRSERANFREQPRADRCEPTPRPKPFEQHRDFQSEDGEAGGQPAHGEGSEMQYQNATVLSNSGTSRFYGQLDPFYEELYRRVTTEQVMDSDNSEEAKSVREF